MQEIAPAWHDLLSDRDITKQSTRLPLDLLLDGSPVGVFSIAKDDS